MANNPIQFKELSNIFTKEINIGSGEKQADGASFGDFLTNAIDATNATDAQSQLGTEALVTGNMDDIGQMMIDGQKAELALQMTVQIRNKVVDAYSEIMRMQL